MGAEKRLMSHFKNDELARNGAVMFISGTIAGALNYIYQVYMGRVLGPEEYGIFGALFAIFYMVGVISQTLGTSTTRFVSKFVGEGKQIGFFIKKSAKHMIFIGIIASGIFLILSSELMSMFKISDNRPMQILALIILLTCIEPIIGGSLRGIKKFKALSIVNISNAFCKLTFGVALVMIGFGVSGALFGIVAGTLIGAIISFSFLRPYLMTNKANNHYESEFRFSSFYVYSLPVMIAMISYSVPSNLDVILAKYFFSSIDAGIYTSVSVLGKIVFFFPGAIGAVMFPMIAEKYAKGENTENLLKKSILYTGILSGSLALVYLIFPGIVIRIFGEKYIGAIDLVGIYGMAMFFFSIIGIIMIYHLALKNMRYIALFTGFTIIEVAGLIIFNSSVVEMMRVLVIANLIFLIVSMVYTFNIKNKICDFIYGKLGNIPENIIIEGDEENLCQ